MTVDHIQNTWVLPHQFPGRLPVKIPVSLLGAAEVIALLGDVSAQSIGHVDEHSLAGISRSAMIEAGLTRSVARLDIDDLSSWFRSSGAGKLTKLLQPENEHAWRGGWVVQLLRGRRLGNPLAWQLLWTAILESKSPQDARQQFAEALAGQRADADGQAKLWPDLESEAVQTRRLREALLGASSIEDLATRMGVSAGTIKRWCDRDPVAKQLWRERLALGRLALARQRIDQFLMRSPGVSRTEVHRSMATDIAWLSVNAPGELAKLLSRVPSVASAQRQLRF